jgi:hypothetical protein
LLFVELRPLASLGSRGGASILSVSKSFPSFISVMLIEILSRSSNAMFFIILLMSISSFLPVALARVVAFMLRSINEVGFD